MPPKRLVKATKTSTARAATGKLRRQAAEKKTKANRGKATPARKNPQPAADSDDDFLAKARRYGLLPAPEPLAPAPTLPLPLAPQPSSSDDDDQS